MHFISQYPKLNNEYFKLVTFICEVYPEKIKSIPAELFGHLMMSIQMAISEYVLNYYFLGVLFEPDRYPNGVLKFEFSRLHI